MNCTNGKIKVVDAIRFEIKPFPKEKVEINALSTDIFTQNTVNLLLKIYNGEHTANKTIESENLRNLIVKEIQKFDRHLSDFDNNDLSEIEKQNAKRNIQKMLTAESAFTAFKVWIIKENKHLLNEFSGFLP